MHSYKYHHLHYIQITRVWLIDPWLPLCCASCALYLGLTLLIQALVLGKDSRKQNQAWQTESTNSSGVCIESARTMYIPRGDRSSHV
jgi:hypothetical protein